MYRSSLALAVVFSAFSSALPQTSQGKSLTGYATFNDYGAQKTGLNCYDKKMYRKQDGSSAGGVFEFNGSPEKLGTQDLVDNEKIFGAAVSDVARGLGTYQCDYSEGDLKSDPAQCTVSKEGVSYKLPNDDKDSPDFYKPPHCPGAQCGKCYTITNKANDKKITVQILDACPAKTAWNYCKAGFVPANERFHQVYGSLSSPSIAILENMFYVPFDLPFEAMLTEIYSSCGDPDTNQVDIDLSAYPVLSGGQAYEMSLLWYLLV
ncbi:MAG: hypothetical protein Q9183_004618 [Haloplaca sp. 2 TL-2023]